MYNQKKLTIRKLVLLSILLAIIVVSLGAYARLTHAGLGCPDWPGCYGMIDVPVSTEQLNKAKIAFPDQVVDPEKAWNEMIHRYFAGALGLLILAIAFLSFRNRGQGTPLRLPLLILVIVTFQAALGMWTVTMKLMPIVVMGHLLGGFTTPYRLSTGDFSVKKYGRYGLIGIVILTAQIALGGWTSSNYAALTCTELPICQSGWVERLTFEDSFDLIPPEKETYEFGHLDHNERLTIHVVHRIGAIVTSIYLAWLLLMVFIKSNTIFFKKLSALVAVLLFTQISLGISNIWFSLPLAVAVGHNVVAACLMLALIMLTYSLRRKI
jgi:cytochrome c oxidase assembly protein subunit 15